MDKKARKQKAGKSDARQARGEGDARRSRARIIAVAAILGPIFYALLIIALGAMQPGYNHVTDVMSRLGAAGAQNAWAMNLFGFQLLGVIIIAFAAGLHLGINGGKGPRTGPALIAIAGMCLFLVGTFRCAPGCENTTPASTVHDAFAMSAFLSMGVALIFIRARMAADRRWAGYAPFTLAVLLVAAALGALFMFSHSIGIQGLAQRAAMAVPLAWMAAVSLRMLRIAR